MRVRWPLRRSFRSGFWSRRPGKRIPVCVISVVALGLERLAQHCVGLDKLALRVDTLGCGSLGLLPPRRPRLEVQVLQRTLRQWKLHWLILQRSQPSLLFLRRNGNKRLGGSHFSRVEQRDQASSTVLAGLHGRVPHGKNAAVYLSTKTRRSPLSFPETATTSEAW